MNYSLAFGIVLGVLIFFLAILFFLSFFFAVIPNPFFRFWQPPPRSLEQILKEDLSVEAQPEVSQELIEQLSVPEERKDSLPPEVPQGVLESLTAPQ